MYLYYKNRLNENALKYHLFYTNVEVRPPFQTSVSNYFIKSITNRAKRAYSPVWLPFRGKFLSNLGIIHFSKGLRCIFEINMLPIFSFKTFMRKLRWPIWIISILKEDIYDIKSAVKTIIFVLNRIVVVSIRKNMILTQS